MMHKCYVVYESFINEGECEYSNELLGLYFNKEDALKRVNRELDIFKEDIKDGYYNVKDPEEELVENDFGVYMTYGNLDTYRYWDITPEVIEGEFEAVKEFCKDLLKLDPNTILETLEKIAYA